MTLIAHGRPDAGQGMCCMGAAAMGPGYCTCWEPVYDSSQMSPHLGLMRMIVAGVLPDTRPTMCADCAYRPESPERSGDERFKCSEPGALDALARSTADRFFCHQGMRRVIAYEHPSGARVGAGPGSYAPPQIAGVPWQANGVPGLLCAGFAGKREAIEKDWPFCWYWRTRLPDRKGQRCRVLARGKMNTIVVQFEDGYAVTTSRFAVRRAR